MESLEMTVEKRDWLKECNDQGVPLDDFRMQFCDRCLNRECTRSQAGKSKFEQRVSTWRERLFDEVPKLNPDDPRIETIQAKRFREVDPGRPHEVSSWVDPRDIAEPPPAEVEEPQEAAPEPEPESPEPEPPKVKSSAPQRFTNTPARGPQMLGGKKVDKQATPPVLDPWEPKKTSETDDGVEVVKPGARIRMGGSGV